MSNPEKKPLIDALRWGRQMSPEEEALWRDHLSENPAQQSSLEDELHLNHLLRQLPDAPLSSNFTARVAQAVEKLHAPAPEPWFNRLRNFIPGKWLPRLSGAALLLCAGLFTYQHHQSTQLHQSTARQELARSVAALSEMAMISGIEVLQDFEAIERLAQVPHDVDAELIVALQSFTP
jgi:anti-sigma factor RsiW